MSTIAEVATPSFPRKTLSRLRSKLTKFASIIGLDLRRAIALRHYPRYLSDVRKFKNSGGAITNSYPIFIDYDDQAGVAGGHYFHQDLLVASFVHDSNPIRHIDVGSRIDGFVAHVATFRQVDVMDVRDLKSTGHKNISFIRADLMDANSATTAVTDSVSCLHAIEHFGLGRYGDPVDAKGHVKGFNNIVRMLKPGGVLYISFPIGRTNEVHFNAHRVFHPKDIFSWSDDQTLLKLERFDYVDDQGSLHQNERIEGPVLNLLHGCGIYTFRKRSE